MLRAVNDIERGFHKVGPKGALHQLASAFERLAENEPNLDPGFRAAYLEAVPQLRDMANKF